MKKEEIIKKRSSIFEGLDIKCSMKYIWVENEKVSPIFWKCQISYFHIFI